jgi:hypothetical protein
MFQRKLDKFYDLISERNISVNIRLIINLNWHALKRGNGKHGNGKKTFKNENAETEKSNKK